MTKLPDIIILSLSHQKSTYEPFFIVQICPSGYLAAKPYSGEEKKKVDRNFQKTLSVRLLSVYGIVSLFAALK